MKQILRAVAVIAFFLYACESGKEEIKLLPIDSQKLVTLVNNALNGDKEANAHLAHLYDLNYPVSKSYNNIQVDSLLTPSKEKIYLILIEFPNPFYNRFAAYDANLNPYIIDKSLNGNLSITRLALGEVSYIRLTENFISKDDITLKRISIYSFTNNSAKLVFRSFTELKLGSLEMKRSIDFISRDTIKTILALPPKMKIKKKSEFFVYDEATKQYITADSTFDKLAADIVQSYSKEPVRPQITDYKSALLSTGYSPTGEMQEKKNEGFSLNLSDDWKVLKDITVVELLMKDARGTYYMNSNLGARIALVNIPADDSAESYVDHPFTADVSYDKKFRSTAKIESKKTIYQFFELVCAGKKYIIILDAPRHTYEKSKPVYDKIINSFQEGC